MSLGIVAPRVLEKFVVAERFCVDDKEGVASDCFLLNDSGPIVVFNDCFVWGVCKDFGANDDLIFGSVVLDTTDSRVLATIEGRVAPVCRTGSVLTLG